MTTDTTDTTSGTDSVSEPFAVAPIALTAGEGEALWFLGQLVTIKSSSESDRAAALRSSSTSPRAAAARRCTCTTTRTSGSTSPRAS